MHRIRLRTAAPIAALLVVLLPGDFVASGDAWAGSPQMKPKDTLRFAAEMARKGNWREAHYRWKQVLALQPDNPRLLNNLAVASEALGEVGEAGEYYRRSLSAPKPDPRVEDNYRRFTRYRRQTRPDEVEDGTAADALPAGSGESEKKGKVTRITVGLPLPPRLELGGAQSLLVASFLTEESAFLDTNRELVRFLRNEFRQNTALEVRDVVPPPAIPEQTLEDLLANREFWQHLGREYDADLIVSGVIEYRREDASGFQDVDIVSSNTGQKVRRTEFVEQEQFSYVLDVFFMEGATGHLLFRDRLQRSAVFRGSQNDPIAAFYELSESIAFDVLSVVVPRTRQDSRVIFKS